MAYKASKSKVPVFVAWVVRLETEDGTNRLKLYGTKAEALEVKRQWKMPPLDAGSTGYSFGHSPDPGLGRVKVDVYKCRVAPI